MDSRGGLELPEALGLGMAVAEFAETEPGKVRQDDQETHQGNDEEQRGEEQGAQNPEQRLEGVSGGIEIVAGWGLCFWDRHWILTEVYLL